MPGVVAVFTGEDLKDVNPLPCAWQAAGVDNNVATPRILALEEVHQVGDPIAVVVAESVYQANDALEAIEVDFEEYPAVVDSKEAIKPGAPQLHAQAPNNIVMHWTCGADAETVDRALSEAEVRVSESLFNQRLIPTAMEPRGSIGHYDPGTEEYTIWATSQAPHWLVSQPMCVPVRPRLSRKKLTSSSRGSTSAAYSTPLTFSLTATRLGAAIIVAIVSALLRLLAAVHHGHGGTESVATSRRLAVTPFRAGGPCDPAPRVRWQRRGRPPDGVSHPTWDWHATWARLYRRFWRLSSGFANPRAAKRMLLGGSNDDFRRRS
jgi:CO/xanthine dehydrogenase Mo-binding subunit